MSARGISVIHMRKMRDILENQYASKIEAASRRHGENLAALDSWAKANAAKADSVLHAQLTRDSFRAAGFDYYNITESAVNEEIPGEFGKWFYDQLKVWLSDLKEEQKFVWKRLAIAMQFILARFKTSKKIDAIMAELDADQRRRVTDDETIAKFFAELAKQKSVWSSDADEVSEEPVKEEKKKKTKKDDEDDESTAVSSSSSDSSSEHSKSESSESSEEEEKEKDEEKEEGEKKKEDDGEKMKEDKTEKKPDAGEAVKDLAATDKGKPETETKTKKAKKTKESAKKKKAKRGDDEKKSASSSSSSSSESSSSSSSSSRDEEKKKSKKRKKK